MIFIERATRQVSIPLAARLIVYYRSADNCNLFNILSGERVRVYTITHKNSHITILM